MTALVSKIDVVEAVQQTVGDEVERKSLLSRIRKTPAVELNAWGDKLAEKLPEEQRTTKIVAVLMANNLTAEWVAARDAQAAEDKKITDAMAAAELSESERPLPGVEGNLGVALATVEKVPPRAARKPSTGRRTRKQ